MLGNTKRCLERKRNERRQSSREGSSSVHKRSPLEPRTASKEQVMDVHTLELTSKGRGRWGQKVLWIIFIPLGARKSEGSTKPAPHFNHKTGPTLFIYTLNSQSNLSVNQSTKGAFHELPSPKVTARTEMWQLTHLFQGGSCCLRWKGSSFGGTVSSGRQNAF